MDILLLYSYYKTIETIGGIMLTLLKDWSGEVEIKDKGTDSIHVILHSRKKAVSSPVSSVCDIEFDSDVKERKITVKKYMTEPASPTFDFMAKWNNNIPMPMRVMSGTVEKETRGMVYMKLHGMGKPTITCRCCGKELTNPVSRNYGIGPICLSKMGIADPIDNIDSIREKLVNITWEGWIIKSAIIEEEEL